MFNRSHLTLVLAATLACAPGEPTLVNKVLLIGLDGVRTDVLARTETPNIDALIAEGFYTDRAVTRMPTVSGPGWSSMLIGVWSDKHGVMGNEFSANDYETYPDFLTRLERLDPAWSTMAVVDWPPMGSEASGGPLISPAVDRLMLFDGDGMGYAAADSASAAWAAQYLARQDPDAAFVYLGNIDVVGHDTNSLSDEYRRAIEVADAQVGDLLAALRARPTYGEEDWLILMSTDHGRTDAGGHGGDSDLERRIFFLVSGPAVSPGDAPDSIGIVDVAVTALTHLGVAIDPEWGLDGRAVGLAHD